MSRSRLFAVLFALAFGAAACGSSDAAEPAAAEAESSETESTDDMTDDMSEEEMADDDMEDMSDGDMDDAEHMDDMSDDDMEEMADDMEDMADDMSDDMALAAWQTLELVDVDGETFTLADYTGTPVFIENFATWCPNCRSQLEDTNAAAAALGDDVAFVALSVETDLSSDEVAAYAADNGFDSIRFAVMTPEFLAAMADAFGNSSINPPSTPHFVIDATGHPGELVTGSESAADIEAAFAS